MDKPLKYTLVSDGPSDRALLPIIDWVLQSIPAVAQRGFAGQHAASAVLRGASGLSGRIDRALHYYPCDLLFVHRDTEASDDRVRQQRCEEIERAMRDRDTPYVCVVPIRMTEAWLLIDADAIRRAAGNSHSQAPLALPPLRRLEQESDPKALLHELLIAASEKQGRRLGQFKQDLSSRRARVADFITDFSPLRHLSAFLAFEAQTLQALKNLQEPE